MSIVVFSLFIDSWYVNFYKNLYNNIYIHNIYRPYVCDPPGMYILLVNNSIDPITPYWSTFINYLDQYIE